MPIVILIWYALALARTRTRPTRPYRWYTVREAAAYTKLAPRTIRKRINEGVLPAYVPRGSRLLRILGSDLDEMMIADGRIASAHLAKVAGDD